MSNKIGWDRLIELFVEKLNSILKLNLISRKINANKALISCIRVIIKNNNNNNNNSKILKISEIFLHIPEND
jgi:hypothetical protein